MIESGTGELAADGKVTAIRGGMTLTVGPRIVHKIVNTGATEMKLLAVLSETPVRVFHGDGKRMVLPWQL